MKITFHAYAILIFLTLLSWNPGFSQTQQLVKDIFPGPESSNSYEFIIANDIIYFIADDGIVGIELWRSDGTETGTWMVLFPISL